MKNTKKTVKFLLFLLILSFIGIFFVLFALSNVKTGYEKIAFDLEQENPEANCGEASELLNERLLAAGYDSRIVSGNKWEFDCERGSNPSKPMLCYDGFHKWVEVRVWIEATNGLIVPNELREYYQVSSYE